MKIVIAFGAIFALLASIVSFMIAKTVVHEMQAMIWLLVAAVLWIGACVLEAIQELTRAVRGAPAKPEPQSKPIKWPP